MMGYWWYKDGLKRKILLKSKIWGYPHFRKPPYDWAIPAMTWGTQSRRVLTSQMFIGIRWDIASSYYRYRTDFMMGYKLLPLGNQT